MTRLPAVLLIVVLAACGGGGGGSGGDGPMTPSGMASDLGCSGFTATTTEEIGVREVGTCTLDGSEVRLLTFATDDARDTFVKVARDFGGIYVVKARQAFEVKSQAVADKVKGKVGDKVQ